jgi:5-methylcytosine-specific restriction endonuclease McrA
MDNKIKPLKNHPTYFIHKDGFIFREYNHKQIGVNKKVNYRAQKITYIIDNIEYDLLNLMIEYFNIKFTPKDNITYKIVNDRLPYSNISVVPFTTNKFVSKKDNEFLVRYQCKQKAQSANSRDNSQITELQVLTILKFSDFSCVYCNCSLHVRKWELDHYIPLSRGGKNTFANLVASCMICNRMKGSLLPSEFLKQVGIIYNKNKIIDLKEELPKESKLKKSSKEINTDFLNEFGE